MSPNVWEPAAGAGATQLAAFTRHVFSTRIPGPPPPGPAARYDALHRWSVEQLEDFWATWTDWAGVRWITPPERILAGGERAMPGARWFPGAALNYAEHALAAAAATPADVAVIGRSQTRDRVELTWAELADQVARCRAGLQRLGVRRGDRVAAYLPNIPETLVAFLASASLGATWASCPPEFGVRSVVDRFVQIEPVVLLTVDGYRYGDTAIDRRAEADQIRRALPSLRAHVTVAYIGTGAESWTELLAEPGPLEFEPVPADHPLYVLYSSGTTGLPKPIVHGHGGITVEHLKVLRLHHDLGPGDRFCWFTTTGWMMWNYLASGLLTGAAVVLFDGSPAFPDLLELWRLAAEERLTLLGVSAPFVLTCRKTGLRPRDELDLGSLRAVAATGAPLPAVGFEWLVDAVSATAQPVSISGGTDVCSAFLGMVPTLPVVAGEITRPLLGCAVEAFDPAGRPVAPGALGELVVTAPMPSMPVGFWGDTDGTRYRAAYFDVYPGVWRHGDWITFTAEGSSTISGRSDATLNRGGVRLGTSDFYSCVEALPEIVDSVVVHLEGDDGGTGMGRLVLFVALAEGIPLDDALRTRITRALRTELSPRHVPDRIEAVSGVPRTLSGKKLEVPVKRILSGTPVDEAAARGSLANPAVLAEFEAIYRR